MNIITKQSSLYSFIINLHHRPLRDGEYEIGNDDATNLIDNHSQETLAGIYRKYEYIAEARGADSTLYHSDYAYYYSTLRSERFSLFETESCMFIRYALPDSHYTFALSSSATALINDINSHSAGYNNYVDRQYRIDELCDLAEQLCHSHRTPFFRQALIDTVRPVNDGSMVRISWLSTDHNDAADAMSFAITREIEERFHVEYLSLTPAEIKLKAGLEGILIPTEKKKTYRTINDCIKDLFE